VPFLFLTECWARDPHLARYSIDESPHDSPFSPPPQSTPPPFGTPPTTVCLTLTLKHPKPTRGTSSNLRLALFCSEPLFFRRPFLRIPPPPIFLFLPAPFLHSCDLNSISPWGPLCSWFHWIYGPPCELYPVFVALSCPTSCPHCIPPRLGIIFVDRD